MTAVATVLAVGAFTGCSASPESQPSATTPAPTASAAIPGAPPDEATDPAVDEATDEATDGANSLAELARSGSTPVQAGSVTLTIAAATTPIGVGPQPDGSVAVTIDAAGGTATGGAATGGDAASAGAADPAGWVTAAVAAPADSSFRVQADGSVSLLDADGADVGALSPARAVDGSGSGRSVRFAAHATDPGLLEVVLAAPRPGAAAIERATVTFTLGAAPLLSLDWGEREGGRSLAVVPAPWARAGGIAARDALWAAVVAAEPEADTPSMLAQFGCHALGAPTKRSWNLEPWRPEVDSFTLLAARCNP